MVHLLELDSIRYEGLNGRIAMQLVLYLRKVWVVLWRVSPYWISREKLNKPGLTASWNGVYYNSASYLINSSAK